MRFDEMDYKEKVEFLRKDICDKEKDILEEKKLLQMYEKLDSLPDNTLLSPEYKRYLTTYDPNWSLENKED